jgi:hypothetical protein
MKGALLQKIEADGETPPPLCCAAQGFAPLRRREWVITMTGPRARNTSGKSTRRLFALFLQGTLQGKLHLNVVFTCLI